MPENLPEDLAALGDRYRELVSQLTEIGFFTAGSLLQRRTVCGTPSCPCHADAAQRHGPYWQYTRKVNGRTVTRRLSAADAEVYEQQIAASKQLRSVLEQMEELSEQALALRLRDAGQQRARPRLRRETPEISACRSAERELLDLLRHRYF